MKRGAAGLLVGLLLLGGCAPGRVVRQVHTVHLPGVMQPVRKLGMAGCPQRPESVDAFGLAWCYSWVAQPGTLPGVETVPMIWDETHVGDAIGGSSAWLMEFNEPDLCPQACLTPAEAVLPVLEIERRYPTRRLVSPAPSQLHLEWLPAFRQAFAQATGRYPRWDALACHCYGTAAECAHVVTQFVAWAQDWAPAGEPALEVWLTETGQFSEVEARTFAAWLAGQAQVTRYALYVSRQDCRDETWDCAGLGDPSLLTAAGALTARGRWYALPWERTP